MEASVRKDRPKHLNLFVIRLPIPGIVSILHRVSGAGLFLMLPLLLWLFGASVNADQADAFRAVAGFWLVKLLLLGLLWAYLHHFCAGIRFLLLDVHVGIDLPTARKSSYIVLAVSLTLTVILGVLTW
ncbi:succinate dehydrogenase, cytochrome b556 subunit [Uliginosibacterium sp. H1]|uniref:succinate dehydrogenase, cytochrome b556 subunit n=1 Tax=Uliginosibacterium sp. H1 TaxID=3114757 RepID=UPI002E193DD8|nr:succinate dehydrogenase, cytochrome b556 subunit [Uliginosibacterium sp. H1]